MQNDQKLLRRGLILEFITLLWNVVGTVVVVYAALRAHSVALAGFGIDSLIEIGASLVVVWELTGAAKGRRKNALRLIGGAFWGLAFYILIQSAHTLYFHVTPLPSPLGIVWLVMTCAAMSSLAAGKHITGTRLNNPVLVTEARVTMVDAILAAAILVGLVLNTFWGWWWADPVAALVLVYYGFKEGSHAWSQSRQFI